MLFMPFNILGIWFRGLLAIAIIVGGIALIKLWYDHSHVAVPVAVTTPEGDVVRVRAVRPHAVEPVAVERRVFRFEPGMNRQTGYLAAGVALLIFAAAGGTLRRYTSMLIGGPRAAPGAKEDEPRAERTGTVHRISRSDGSELQIEAYGPVDAPPIVMSHGWGANSTEWFYAKKSLGDRFRLILWDEPGLGLSKKPADNDFRMENLATDLKMVLEFAGDRPAVLVGHSIGGMIILTLCKAFPGLMGRQVAGLVLVHTTYTNPVRTTRMAGLYTAIEKPVIIPLLYMTIALWPLVWAMNWLSYLNGSIHRSTHKQSFAGGETRGQLDYFAKLSACARPDVLARGMLGMIGYDATAVLATISVPTLVVVGDRDSTTLPEAGRHISRNVRGARLDTLSPAKHLGLIEHHGRFDQMVASFSESCLLTGVAH